jgi:2-dehydro-3-deoxygalactonokinase
MAESMRWSEGFIAVDWGTTNRRAYVVDCSGKPGAEFDDSKGVLSVDQRGFPAAIAEIRQKLGDKPLLMAGMIGSNRGWKEAPYVPCPAGVEDLAKAIVWAGDREAIVPGVSYVGNGRADIMRGEEVQLLGAVAAGMIDQDALVCHPGTHNKWALVRRGQLASFRTVMTGELFNLLKTHSILSDLLQGKVESNDAFLAGAQHGWTNNDMSADLFAIRARVLLNQAKAEDAASYASGLLIGSDVRIGLSEPLAAQVVVMGRPELTRLYAAAIKQAGREAIEVDGEKSFVAGISKIAEVMT